MRIAVLGLLVLLAMVGAFGGHLWIALAVAAAKGILVAWEYMELRHAERAHLTIFSLALVALALALGLSASLSRGTPSAALSSDGSRVAPSAPCHRSVVARGTAQREARS